MPQTIVRYTILLLALLTVQVLICNHIMLFGVAMPIVFIYFLLAPPMNTDVKLVLILGFLSGFAVDIFSDTPGVNSLSCTVLAVMRKPVFRLYTGGDEALANVAPSISTAGFASFAKYLLTLCLLYCTLCFTLEYFTFAYFTRMIEKITASTALSSLLIFAIDGLVGTKHT